MDLSTFFNISHERKPFRKGVETEMSLELETVVEIARAAGEIIRDAWGEHSLVVSEKGSAINPVTDVDRRCEDLIKNRLSEAFQGDGILSEESEFEKKGNGRRWIVDPIDGTTNFIRRYPFVAVSIGLESNGEVILGVVYNPILQEFYLGETGRGATLNNIPLHISNTVRLDQAVLASGFPYDTWTNPENNTREWAHFIRRVRSMRCDGSAALDLCAVASGRLDGYWEKGLSQWDMAAGIIIAREAGAIVTDYDGGADSLARGEVIAANPRLHPQILKEINR